MGILEKTLIWTKKLQVCQGSFLPLLENNFLAEIKLCNLSGSAWKINGFLGKNGWHICQKRIPRDKWILLRKMKFLSKKSKTLNSFSELQWNKIVFLCSLIRQGCQNWNPRAQRPFWKRSAIRVHFLFFSWNFSRKTWIGHTNYGFARKAFYVSSGTFQGAFMRRNQNFGRRAKKHLFLANRYWQSCQNSFPCVQRNTLRKMNFCRNFIKFRIFFDSHQELLNLGKICCQEFKPIFKCPEKHFEKNLLWRKIQFNDFFLGFSKKSLTGKKSVSRMSGKQYTCLGERFD